MQDSTRLMSEACRGERPERTPIFDILVNDAIIAHFAGAPLDGTDDVSVSARAIGRSLDGTRHLSVPNEEGKTGPMAGATSMWPIAGPSGSVNTRDRMSNAGSSG